MEIITPENISCSILCNSADADILCYLIGANDKAEKIFKTVNNDRLKLICVKVEDWNRLLSPWKTEKVFSAGDNFGGEAEYFLNQLEHEIIPQIEKEAVSHRIIAGYSLAGLFAVWSCYNSKLFDALVSCSGSTWFDGFTDYAENRKLLSPLAAAYFSLGDKEKKTRNRRMASVEQCTEKINELISESCENTIFKLVPGNHFNEPEMRLARGISYVLKYLNEGSVPSHKYKIT